MILNKKGKTIILIILSIYLGLVTQQVKWYWYDYIFFIIKSSFFYIILKYAWGYFNKITINNNDKLTKNDYFKLFVCIFIVMLIALYIYYPINFQWDVRDQYNQVLNNKYSDWHPIIHTLMFYRLPTLLIKNEIMCCLFQMIIIDLILLYFSYNLNQFGFNRKKIIFIISLFILNPSFDIMAITPIKDTIFSYCIFLVTLFFINIYLTKGLWLKSKVNSFLFFFSCFGITFFRHNGIFTFLIMMILLIFLYKNIRKRSVCIFLIMLSLRFLFVPFIYNLNGISKTNVTISEMVCVLLNQIGYIYKNDGNITSKQLKQLEKYQNLDKIDMYYDPYNYNSAKYKMDYHGDYSKNINNNPKEFFKLYKDIVINNKILALESYKYTTYCIWHIAMDTSDNLRDLFLLYNSNKDFSNDEYINIQNSYFAYKKSISNCYFSIIFPTVAMGLFYIIFSLFYCLLYSKNKFKEKLKVLLPYVPVLSNLLLMLILLPGRETRFVYSNILCSYVLIIFMILINNNLSNKNLGGSNK